MRTRTSFDLFVNFGLGGIAVILILFFSLRAKQPSKTERSRAQSILLILLVLYLVSRVLGIL